MTVITTPRRLGRRGSAPRELRCVVIFAMPAYIGVMTEMRERILEGMRAALPEVSQAQLARDVDMDPSALSRALNGKRGLSGAEVAAIARRLKVSTDWLLLGEDPFPVLVAARHGYNGGGYSAVLGEDSAGAVAGVITAYEQAGELPAWPRVVDVPTDAGAARRMLADAYGEGWQRHLADAVERAFGIDVVKLPLPDHDGVSLRLPNATVMVIPVEAFWGRQNWTIAHELWHIAHNHFTPLTQGAQPDGEQPANTFAAELLMPETEMRQIAWGDLDEAALAQWLWTNGVSLHALRLRLSRLGLDAPAFDGTPLSLLRRHVSGPTMFDDPVTERITDAAARRFPARLLARHQELGSHPSTLSWMLGAPYAPDSGDETPRVNKATDLAALFGLTPA